QPVERFLPNTDHVDVSQLRFEHKGTDNFFEALRAFLRHDPDVINVGEIRDTQSCGVTVDAANTGHLVTATTHANDPVMGFRRLAS
ncbi:type II/IV secretion system protein, partial [Bacillus thuringiensis]|nr:type II/IV secretion system protein [Bacillus thuringiensis]